MSFDVNLLPLHSGKLAIVTGANTGLGFDTTRYLAMKDIKVVMACRSLDRANAARETILQELPNADLEVMQLDLSSLASVRAFAEQFKAKHQQLDLLINNAGIMMTPYAKTEDGFEGQMAANYFGHFLLTSLLIDRMPDTPESRVVTLSSIAHKQGLKRIQFEDIHWENRYDKREAYAQSKLACLMFTLELQRRLEAAGKSILSVGAHPGISLTELVRSMNPLTMFFIKYTVGFFFHPPHEGALPTVRAALESGLKGGSYIGPKNFMEVSGPPVHAKIKPHALDEAAAKELWDVSLELTGASFNL